MLLLNDRPVNYFRFPNGELQVKVDALQSERSTLTWKPQNSDDFILLLLTVNALKHRGCNDIVLDILYLPYARQDRIFNAGEPHSLEVITKIIDSRKLSLIKLWDSHNSDTYLMFPHTAVFETEIHNILGYYNFLDNFDLSNLILCAPSIEMRSKVDSIVNEFELGTAIHFEKFIEAPYNLLPNKYNRKFEGYDILVVNDICDDAGIFIQLAEELRKETEQDLYLYVTHGIFSSGYQELLQHYKHIYCHHVLNDCFRSGDKLTILREFNHVSPYSVCF